jgi:hypothetical protein
MNSQVDFLTEIFKKMARDNANWVTKLPRLTHTHPLQPEMCASEKFYCLLDEQPDDLVPERFQRAARVAAQETRALIVNPLCWFSDEGIPPLGISTQFPLMQNFLLDCYTIWVEDAITGNYTPFALGPEYSKILKDLRANRLTISDLPIEVRTNLLLARIVTKRDFIATRRQEWTKKITQANAQFQKGHYAVLQDLLPPLMIGALRRYYRHLIQEGYLELGDGQCPLRYGIHNESITRFLQQQFNGVIDYVVGAPVKASYTYLGAYQGGAELLRHTDREQCEYTMTFCIDYSPEPEKETPWPIYAETPEGEVEIFQCIGDGLLFKGRELPHYRHKLEEDSSSTSIFFHYVDVDFQGPLD